MTRVSFFQQLSAIQALLLLGNFFLPRASCTSVAQLPNKRAMEDIGLNSSAPRKCY